MLRFQDVSLYYDDSTALEHLDFEIGPGEFVILTGPSGAGKTSLMRLIARHVTADEGTVYFEDEDLSTLKGKKLLHHRRQIGVIFQDYKLLPELNAWENIALALSIAGHKGPVIEERVSELLELVGLSDKAMLFPSQLSGGEAQRISIARSLANDPKLVFADEPTGNLDEKNAEGIFKLLHQLHKEGRTIICATHDPMMLNFKDQRVITLAGGVLESDTATKANRAEKQSEAENEEVEKSQDEEASETEPDEAPESTSASDSSNPPDSKKKGLKKASTSKEKEA